MGKLIEQVYDNNRKQNHVLELYIYGCKLPLELTPTQLPIDVISDWLNGNFGELTNNGINRSLRSKGRFLRIDGYFQI